MKVLIFVYLLLGFGVLRGEIVEYNGVNLTAERFLFGRFLVADSVVEVELDEKGGFVGRKLISGELGNEEFLKLYGEFVKVKGYALAEKGGLVGPVKNESELFYLFVGNEGEVNWWINHDGFLNQLKKDKWENVWYEKTRAEMVKDLRSFAAWRKKGVFRELEAGTFGESGVKVPQEWFNYFYAVGPDEWSVQLVRYFFKHEMKFGDRFLRYAWGLAGRGMEGDWLEGRVARLEGLLMLIEAYGDDGEKVFAQGVIAGMMLSGERPKEWSDEDFRRVVVPFGLKAAKNFKGRISVEGLRAYFNLAVELDEVELFDFVFKRISEGDSAAHLPFVGWILESDYCVKGGVIGVKKVLGCLEKRDEREVVWLVSGLLGREDEGVKKSAREFLVKRVGKDFGGGVEGWRAWVLKE